MRILLWPSNKIALTKVNSGLLMAKISGIDFVLFDLSSTVDVAEQPFVL